MANNRGKQFEAKFLADFKATVPDCSIDRLYDPEGGRIGIRNLCDFVGFKKPSIMYLECKSHEGNTFPLANLTQYDKLVAKVGIPGVRAGVVIWFIDHDRVIYVPIKTVKQMKEDGKKSVNIRTIDKDGYRFFEIPSKKKRVFMDSNYSILTEMEDGD